ncbi:MAG: MFS transporter [Microbacteriaceae bacterium]|nr:MFS transporter [Microbacteriaceae bacterium]
MLSAAGVACFTPVDVIYFQNLGYSLSFVGLMMAAFNLAVTIAELPFAIVFDRYSNKLALQIGNLLRMIAFAIFFFNLNQPSLVLAQVIAGFAVAAMSGTSNALIVNQIQNIDSDKVLSAFARISYLSAAAAILGGVIGVFIFAHNPRYIWVAALCFFIAAGIVAFTFTETKADIEQISLGAFMKKAAKTVSNMRALALIITNGAAVAPFILWQIKFNQVSLTFLVFGFIGMQLATLFGVSLLKTFRVRANHVAIVAFLNIGAVIGFALASGEVAVWVTFVLHVALQGMLAMLVDAIFHAKIPNDVRATSGSVVSLADSLIVAVCAPGIALVAEQFGFTAAIIISCGIYAIITLMHVKALFTKETEEIKV